MRLVCNQIPAPLPISPPTYATATTPPASPMPTTTAARMHYNDLCVLDFVVIAATVTSAEILVHSERRRLSSRRQGQTHADNDCATRGVSQQLSAIDCVHGFLLSKPSFVWHQIGAKKL